MSSISSLTLSRHLCHSSSSIREVPAAAGRLFANSTCWLREELSNCGAGCKNNSSSISSNADEMMTLAVGLTGSQLDEIGDPTRVTCEQPGRTVQAGAALAKIAWEGFSRTASDELYHAVWAHSQGNSEMSLPFAATVHEVNPLLHSEPGHLLHPDEEVWVLRVKVLTRDFMKAMQQSEVLLTPEVSAGR